jgi:hypothetical protein
MKKQITLGLATLALAGAAKADGLYYVGAEAQESLPLKWVIGLDATYDDNVSPGATDDEGNVSEESGFSLNPYIGLSLVNITPQTTVDLYTRLGAIYYVDSSNTGDDLYGQARVGLNITHRVNERLRFVTRNFVSYELEPDYSYGFATGRQQSEYFFWQTDNAVGYRWSERFATYTGFTLEGINYGSEVNSADRFTWTLYNQFRYQLNPQTVLTLDYRYSETEGDGFASDSNDQYILVGAEHRFSPNSILIVRAGAQIREVDQGDDSTNPFLELATSTRVNEAFTVRAFARYGAEYYDTVQVFNNGVYDFSERQTLRVGVSAEYAISPTLALFGGVDYIPSTFDQGNLKDDVSNPLDPTDNPDSEVGSLDEDLINAYVGLSVKFTDYLSGSVTYNFTNSDSDFNNRDYDRNRLTVGVRAEF